MSSIPHKLRLTLEMIKFEHSVFALPFALTGALLAVGRTGSDRGPGWKTALDRGRMVCARSAAMAFNRVLDAADRRAGIRAPSMRHLPAGLL